MRLYKLQNCAAQKPKNGAHKALKIGIKVPEKAI